MSTQIKSANRNKKREALQLHDSLTNMDISAHAGNPGALQDARKQRYFLPLSDGNKPSQIKSQILYNPGVHNGTRFVTDLHAESPLDSSTTYPSVIDTQREELPMPPMEPVLVASPTASNSDSSTPALPEPGKKSSALPSSSTLDKAAHLTVDDAQGQAIPFSELYRADPGQRRRVMIIFIRHFFCGNCQEFLRSLIALIVPTSLPADTSIAIIGCGSHTLISSYAELTSCPYPIYADPTKKLFDLLGMHRTLSLGWHAPNYIQQSLAAGVVKSIVQGVKRIPAGDVTKAGDWSQNGGEYLFEVEGVDTRSMKQEHGYKPKGNAGLKVKVTFCHRMRNSRDHTEIAQLVELLGLTGGNERRRRPNSGLERRWTAGGTIGSLARSLSNKREWLRRRSSSSWSKTRKRGRSESSNPGNAAKRTSPERIESVSEDMKSQDHHSPIDETTNSNAVVQRFSFDREKR